MHMYCYFTTEWRGHEHTCCFQGNRWMRDVYAALCSTSKTILSQSSVTLMYATLRWTFCCCWQTHTDRGYVVSAAEPGSLSVGHVVRAAEPGKCRVGLRVSLSWFNPTRGSNPREHMLGIRRRAASVNLGCSQSLVNMAWCSGHAIPQECFKE